ncbi:MAG: hypothetical protein R6W78_15675 [Bacteroidales bacterium]
MKLTNMRNSVLLLLFIMVHLFARGQYSIEPGFNGNFSGLSGTTAAKDMPYILEVAHGQAFTDWTDSWAWMFYCNFLVPVKKNIAIGAGTGLQFDWTGLYPLLSVNSIFGNKSEGFAAGVDVRGIFTSIIDSPGERIWVTAGLYYKNFFIKTMPTFIFGYPKEWYFETGYSFNIKL